MIRCSGQIFPNMLCDYAPFINWRGGIFPMQDRVPLLSSFAVHAAAHVLSRPVAGSHDIVIAKGGLSS
jgi:hypothetical protein